MDSLLVILAVIGVVMILAGIARMKSKKRPEHDDIDHSVLFTKKDEPKKRRVEEEAISPDAAPHMVADDGELTAEEEFQFLDNLLTEKEKEAANASALSVTLDDDERRQPSAHSERQPAHDEEEHTESSVHAKGRSLLHKLRSTVTGEDDDFDDDEDLIEPCYRDGAPDKVVILNVVAPKDAPF